MVVVEVGGKMAGLAAGWVGADGGLSSRDGDVICGLRWMHTLAMSYGS